MFFNILKHTLKNIVRNKFLTFSSIIVIGLLMFFTNILVVLHEVSFKVIHNVNSKISIDLYLKDDYDDKSIEYKKFKKEIQNLDKNIKIKYLSKQEIFEETKKKTPEIVEIVKGIDNPFPNTIFISNVNIDDYNKLDKIIRARLSGPDAIFDETEGAKSLGIIKGKNTKKEELDNNYKQKISKIEKLSLALKSLGFGIYFIIFIFVASIFVIIYSIIGNFIFHYRNEIFITKLIGGSKRFIYGPFVLQGIIYSLIALLISTLGFYYLLDNINSIFSSFDINLNINLKESIKPVMEKLLPIEILAFSFIGALSGFLSSRKYSKEIKY